MPSKVDWGMFQRVWYLISAVHLLRPEFDLPAGDSKAEALADLLASKVELNDLHILDIANLAPLEDKKIDLLQQVLCKLSTSVQDSCDSSCSMLCLPTWIPPRSLLPLTPHYPEQWTVSLLSLYLRTLPP
jgi:hypothetical protein